MEKTIKRLHVFVMLTTLTLIFVLPVIIAITIGLIFFSPKRLLKTHSGTYSGTIVDVSWGGLFFEDCEVVQRTSMKDDANEKSSTRDRQLCDQLKELSGKDATLFYDDYLVKSIRDSSKSIIRGIK